MIVKNTGYILIKTVRCSNCGYVHSVGVIKETWKSQEVMSCDGCCKEVIVPYDDVYGAVQSNVAHKGNVK